MKKGNAGPAGIRGRLGRAAGLAWLVLLLCGGGCSSASSETADVAATDTGDRDAASGPGLGDFLIHAREDGGAGDDGGAVADVGAPVGGPDVASPPPADTAAAADLPRAPDLGEAPEDTGPPPPGPDHPLVDCARHESCPDDGDDPGVCCTKAVYDYHSWCSTLAECGPGGRDACLTDEQCQARDASRPVCCHDRGFSHYCAPALETCQPIEPCDSYADCGNENRICCSRHEYYRLYVCTNTFLANSPEFECPPSAE